METIEYPDGTVRTIFCVPGPLTIEQPEPEEAEDEVSSELTFKEFATVIPAVLGYLVCVDLFGMHTWFWAATFTIVILYTAAQIIFCVSDHVKRNT